MAEGTEKTYCLNCNTPYPNDLNQDKEFFCPNCGQSSKDSKLSFSRLIKDAISNVLNLDSRLIHTTRDILFPSKLTRSYIEGRRKYYVNPARLFIFSLIGLITLALSSITLENSSMGVDDIYARAERSKLMEEYDNLLDTIDIEENKELTDTIKSRLFNKARSLKTDTLGKNGFKLFSSGRSVKSFGISIYDAVHLNQDTLFKKYNVEKFADKLMVGQYIRIVTDPAGGIKYVIQNLTWAIFIAVLFMSFFMKLLYIRNPYYLVEHVVLILNSHSLLFLLTILNIVLLVFTPLGNKEATIGSITSSSTIIVFIIQFLTLKKYYKQGFFKTLIKQIIINLAYVLIFFLVVFAVALISLLLY